MKNTILILFIILLFTGCGSVNPLEGTGGNFGFLSGIWDGFTVLFSFIGKIFGANVNIYEVYNNGNWYNFGI
ncbi:hypothetical protein [Aliarcobacter butzleri]|uniref:hypothetical protein n=1 Tax=Aliarcobacter butzleri TaxID=28197 RepID=UPI002B247799|nr:hypothetical protein [Aliarcobacter butzleri]